VTRLVNTYRERCDVRITRPSEYGNPVSLGKRCPVCDAVHTREQGVQALLCYAQLLLPRLHADRAFVRGLHAMEGTTLGCVCAPAHCHGELLLAYLDGYSERLAIICGADEPTDAQAQTAHGSGLNAVASHIAWLHEQLPAQRQLL